MPVHRTLTFLITAAAALSVAQCTRPRPATPAATAPPVIQEPPPSPPPPVEAAIQPPSAPVPLSDAEVFASKTLDELNAEMPLGDVYFDLDQFGVDGEGRIVLQRNAEWLQRWPSTRVTAEGHGDARGTNEYNLALGDRRSRSARDYIVSLGVDGGRVVVVSKGEEAPICGDESEDCWSRNRRVRFVITAK